MPEIVFEPAPDDAETVTGGGQYAAEVAAMVEHPNQQVRLTLPSVERAKNFAKQINTGRGPAAFKKAAEAHGGGFVAAYRDDRVWVHYSPPTPQV